MNQRIILFTLVFAFGQVQNSNASEKTNQTAPNCSVSSISDSQSYNLQQFKGKVVYVDFWASWCSPCLQSFPFMNKLEQEFKDKGLQILAINMDENLSDAQDFLIKQPAKFKIASDTKQQCAKAFNVRAMPSSYLIDRNGIIRHEHLGFRSGETEELQNIIKQLLAETPSAH
jgi:thiol-disulfide isomerase/thioredoxin